MIGINFYDYRDLEMKNENKCEEKEELYNTSAEINPLLNEFRTKFKAISMELCYFNTSDNFPLFYRIWRSNPNSIPDKIILCIHGLHSHGEKFILFADHFIENNWDTYAIDLRSHGLSWLEPNTKGDIPEYTIWLNDLKEFVENLYNNYPNTPIYIVAESMGAALSIHLAMLRPMGLKGLVLLSPALKPWTEIQITMIIEAFLFALFKKSDETVIPHKGDKKFATNNDKYIEYQLNDPLKISNASPRYYYQVIKMIHNLKNYDFTNFLPTCMFFGEKDRLIDFEGLKTFTKLLDSTPKALHYIPEAYHDLLTDEEAMKYQLFKKIVFWIDNYG